jgi:hypothetical protein
MNNHPGEGLPRGRFDPVNAMMALVASIAIASLIWTRFGPVPPVEAPRVGSALPMLHLLDPETSEPLLLLGLRGKVVWVCFWSSASPSSHADVAELDRQWTRLKSLKRFAMAAVSVDADRAGAEAVRAAVAASGATLPVYRGRDSGPVRRRHLATSASSARRRNGMYRRDCPGLRIRHA